MLTRVLRTLRDIKPSDYTDGNVGRKVASYDEADVITSELVDLSGKAEWHAPVLDIDFPAMLIPSTTPGHYHLYLEKAVPHRQYMKLLKALGSAGIIEPGYAAVSRKRGHTAVRLPWVQKRRDLEL
jgi:hypothetical protein